MSCVLQSSRVMSTDIVFIKLLIIGSIMQYVVPISINPAAADNPCIDASGYNFNALNQTQLTMLIETVHQSSAIMRLYPTPANGSIFPGEQATFLCCALVSGHGWSELEWTRSTIPQSRRDSFDWGRSSNTDVTTYQNRQISIFDRRLQVRGSLDLNGTDIECYTNGFEVIKQLIVMGPPSSPAPSLELIAHDTMKVSWDLVLTLLKFPVIGYNVTVIRNSTRGVLVTRQTTTNEVTISRVNLVNHGMVDCEELVFTVTAANSLGHSQPGHVSGWFPNTLSSFGPTIAATVFYTSDLEPRVHLTITVPPLCQYQMLSYTVVLEGQFNNTHKTLNISEEVHVNLEKIHVEVSPALGLALQQSYNVYATLYSDGGQIVTTDSKTFNTVLPNCVHGNTMAYNSTTASASNCDYKCNNDVILYCLAALCVLLFFTLVLTLCGLCSCWIIRKRKFRSSSRTGIRSGMVTNPIYDGPIYDIIKNEKGRLISTSSAASPSSGVFPEFPEASIPESKLVDYSLPPQPASTYSNVNKQVLEPRYSSTASSSENTEFYVKMKGKVNSNDSTSQPGGSVKLDLAQDTSMPNNNVSKPNHNTEKSFTQVTIV